MATLKISDLSVGDWVMVEWPDGERWRGRLTRLSVTGGVEVCCANGKHVRCSLDFLSPIPITAEILEKNGFVKNGGVYLWSNKKHRVFVCLKEFSPYVDIEEMDEQFDTMSSRIEVSQLYAHWLQHALRLAGVDKEITL
jgi:hypothetical protein